MVPHFPDARADFAEHIEMIVAASSGVFVKTRQKIIVQGQTGNVFHRVDAEIIDAHADKIPVAFHQIFGDDRIFRVEIDAIAGDLRDLFAESFPREVTVVMIDVVRIGTVVFRVLHVRNPRIVLLTAA